MKGLTQIAAVIFLAFFAACGTPSAFPVSEPTAATVDDRIVGKWKYVEDTNKLNFYEVYKARGAESKYEYHVRFWNRGGTNPTYEANIHLSSLKDHQFINVPFWEKVGDKGDHNDWQNRGYFFLKILEQNNDFTRITTATVKSTELLKVQSSAEARTFLLQNLNNPRVFSDTAHFYKVSE